MVNDSEINIEKFTSLIKEYENLIQQLTNEVEFYRNEQDHLKTEILSLIDENKNLSAKINELLNFKNNNAKEHTYPEKTIIDNLQNQLSILTREKETTVELWQSALKTIDQLEEELKLFEGRTHGYVSKSELQKAKKEYEIKILSLENENKKLQNELENALKTSETKLMLKTSELNKALEGQKNTFVLVQNLEEEVKVLQQKYTEIMCMRDKLEKLLEERNNRIEFLKTKDKENKNKVQEAVQIVEAALLEKDAALMRENQAKEEVAKMSKMISELVEETGEKVKNEVESVKTKYNIKFKKVQSELKLIEEELKLKNDEVTKYKQQCKQLELELERVYKGNLQIDESSTSKLLLLEKNLESTFQKLLLAERRNLQLASERDSIKFDLEQMGSHYERDIKSRELEKREMQHKIKALKTELQASNDNLMQVAEKMDNLNTKIKSMEAEVLKQFQMKEKTWKNLVTEKINKIKEKNSKEKNELIKCLESQTAMNKKWKTESKDIIEKLIKHIKELGNEATELKIVNKELDTKLSEAEKLIVEYKSKLAVLKTVSKIRDEN